jgi:hypothetical protein
MAPPPTSPDNAVDLFLQYFNAHDTANVMTVFCADTPANPPPPKLPDIPTVGLAHDGPQFKGRDLIETLFIRLFKSFPDISLAPLPGLTRLYSQSGPTRIAFQAKIIGTHDDKWFEKSHPKYGDKLYSPPISDIDPDQLHAMNLAACPIFALDASYLITNWTIYFDRYRMWRQLQPDQLSKPALMGNLLNLASSFASKWL